jgi:hypothetical protein
MHRRSTAKITVSESLVAAVSKVIIGANPKRKGLIIYNNGGNTAYITFGPVSAGNACTTNVASFQSWSMLGNVVYTGQIAAIRNAGTGVMVITELE